MDDVVVMHMQYGCADAQHLVGEGRWGGRLVVLYTVFEGRKSELLGGNMVLVE